MAELGYTSRSYQHINQGFKEQIMDIIPMATQLLNDKLGLQLDSATVSSALSGLMGDGQGGIDLAGLAGKMSQSGEFGSLLNSWLGDGANAAISADSLVNMFGEGGLSQFAGALGTDTNSAAQGLAEVLPQMMDQVSSGGNLLESVGGLDGLMGAAKSFLS
jgi:uncharacterized protein YidB (DUF937 family)